MEPYVNSFAETNHSRIIAIEQQTIDKSIIHYCLSPLLFFVIAFFPLRIVSKFSPLSKSYLKASIPHACVFQLTWGIQHFTRFDSRVNQFAPLTGAAWQFDRLGKWQQSNVSSFDPCWNLSLVVAGISARTELDEVKNPSMTLLVPMYATLLISFL